MSGRGERAQTGIDFLVGMSVFLIAVGFVFAFVPSMFAPFGGPDVNDALIADRSAAYLAEYALVEEPANPGVLSTACTAVFFSDSIGDVPEQDCVLDSEDDLSTLFGVKNHGRNIQMRVVETNESGEIITVEGEYDGESFMMQSGDNPPSTSSDTVSQRVVSIYGEAYELRVWVWS